MEFGQLLAKLWADQLTNNALILVIVVPVLDLLTGVARAIANGTFDLALVDVWVRTQLAGRVIPIVLVLIFGAVIGNITLGSFSFNVITVAAVVAAVTFIAADAVSIIGNLQPSTPDKPPTA